jgi:hypothetical protein
MADISKLRTAVIEKQDLILNKLTTLSYEDVILDRRIDFRPTG